MFSPHTRGCSYRTWEPIMGTMVFPHTRGCSLHQIGGEPITDVFPAYAGMFLLAGWWHWANLGFPRIRGDVPALMRNATGGTQFSPHTRGCSPQPLW